MNKLLDSSLTASTSSSYTHAWSTFRNFAEKYSLRTDIPIQQHILVLYVAFLFSQDYAPSTITSYLSAISHVHKLNGLQDPCSSFVVQKVLTGARKLKPTTDVRIPITRAILHKLLDSLQHTISNLYEKILFRAMFSLAFYGFLRIGEITSSLTVPNKNLLHFNQISIVNDTILIKFVSYKHSLGKPFFLTIHGAKDSDFCPVQCLKNYINQRGVQEGPLFCYVLCTPVTRIKFSVILKNCLSFANIQMGKITSHSFRIGMASHCADCGMSDGKIRLLGRWKSDALNRTSDRLIRVIRCNYPV